MPAGNREHTLKGSISGSKMTGAVETVMPENMAQRIPTEQTYRSRHGGGFRAANGTHIKHYGQKNIVGYGDQFQGVKLKAQVAEVRSALGSVSQTVNASVAQNRPMCAQ